MNDAGYTLTETLAALTVIGMAVGGLSLGSQVIGRQQLATSRLLSASTSVRSTQQMIEGWLTLGAPFGSEQPDRFSGDATQFHFQCGAPSPCAAQILADAKNPRLKVTRGGSSDQAIILPLAGSARFVYRSSKTTGDVWPPSDTSRQALRSIILLQMAERGEAPLVEARIWTEQSAQCAFDPVMQDCR